MTKSFDTFYSDLVLEMHIADDRDPNFYDFLVILIKALRDSDLFDIPVNIQETAQRAMEEKSLSVGREDLFSYNLQFIFTPGLSEVKIVNQADGETIHSLPLMHEETMVKEIVDYLNQEKMNFITQDESPVEEMPGQTSKLPEA